MYDGWRPSEMVRGLALAESTPGPLIMVVQFVAFVGAYRDPGSLNPWVAAVLAALLTTWVTFVPCFVFIFLGAPYVERLRGNRNLSAALTGITAAVVGVIANLAVYFALHTLFTETTQVSAGIVLARAAVLAWIGGRRRHRRRGRRPAVPPQVAVLSTLGVCALLGLAAGFGRPAHPVTPRTRPRQLSHRLRCGSTKTKRNSMSESTPTGSAPADVAPKRSRAFMAVGPRPGRQAIGGGALATGLQWLLPGLFDGRLRL